MGNLKTNMATMTVKIDSNLEDKEYHFVTLDTTDDLVVNLATGPTLVPWILEEGANGATEEKLGAVALPGSVTKLKLAEAVTANKFLTSDANGQAEVCDAAGERYGAMALEGGAAGDIIRAVVVFGEVEDSDA